MSFYVYCLSDELGREQVETLEGVAGARVQVSEWSGLAAVVSEFDGARVALTRENLRAHNRVLAHVLALTTPLPFRFGTLAGADEIEAYAAKNSDAVRAGLARVRGCVEMSLKILWDAGAAARESPEESPTGAGGGEETRSLAAVGSEAAGGAPVVGSGAAFLAAKRAALAGEERSRVRAEEVAAWAAESLRGVVRETRARVSPSERIVLRASHLVERARLGEYREAVGRLREGAGAELRFLTSGAWPPYSFCEPPR